MTQQSLVRLRGVMTPRSLVRLSGVMTPRSLVIVVNDHAKLDSVESDFAVSLTLQNRNDLSNKCENLQNIS